jgi:hypothetical protein
MRPKIGTPNLVRQNLRIVKELYPGLNKEDFSRLRELTRTLHLSVSKGELLYIQHGWYVTHGGLLQIALRRRCAGIHTVLQERQCDAEVGRWVFKAVVRKSSGRSSQSNKFSGYGDADPSNVSPLVRGAEMRVAETRAVNRALRKAYGIGLCSVEELGWTPRVSGSPKASQNGSSAAGVNGNGHSAPPRLRDRLCLLIREHQLDAALVKAYAADSCGTPNLRDATREQIEGFITNLSDWATKDRPALLCKLNSYSRPQEPTS